MIRRFAFVLVAFALVTGGLRSAWAAAYPLIGGTVLEGEPIAFDIRGVVVKTDDGSARRMGWTNFTQEALKELAKQPKAKPFAEPYLEVDEPEPAKKPTAQANPPLPATSHSLSRHGSGR